MIFPHPPSFPRQNTPRGLSRREALQRILVASALAVRLDLTAFAVEEVRRIGEDPNLLVKEIPWARVLTEGEKRIVTVLADLLIPADAESPAASAVGVTDFIDEWVSAPYEMQQADLAVIRTGLAWIEGEAKQRFATGFAEAAPAQQTEILDEIVRTGTPAFTQGIAFFRLLRDRVAGGYYSTPEGWKAIGYTGNVPSLEFAGPPPELLAKLGFA